MGRALADAVPAAAAVFAEADEILGMALSRLCWEGPEADLNDTLNTQPALLVHSVAVLRALEATGYPTRPATLAGHSLGEFSALVAAGALAFPQALRLVRERGRVMKDAGARQPGGMAAVLGVDVDRVDEACRVAREASGSPVEVANDNCPGQVVISGAEAGLAAATEGLRAMGAKRVIRLAVSIAAHSSLMMPARESFRRTLAAARVDDPMLEVIGNVGVRRLGTAAEVRADLEAQLTSRVRWTESIRAMIAEGVTTFFEIGTGEVLSGLVRRTDSAVAAHAVDAPDRFALLTA